MRLLKNLAVSIAAFCLSQQVAYAGLASFVDEIAGSSRAAQKGLREVLTDDTLYSRVIRDLIPQSAGAIATGAFRKALRTDIFQFATAATRLSWERADLSDYLTKLVSKKCSAASSCAIAFDLAPSQIDGFLDELAATIQKAVDTRLPELDAKMIKLKNELAGLTPNSSSRTSIKAEMDAVQKEIDSMQKYTEAAAKLSPGKAPDLSDLHLLCP